MVNFGDEFHLSRWFNNSSSSGSSAHATDSEDGDAAGSVDDAVAPSASANLAECYICHMPNPEFMSTNTVKKAPPVPVCSVGCEAKYLEMKGMRPSGDSRNADPNHCFVCQAPDPEYSVSSRGAVTPVCSKECEEAFLRRKKQRGNGDEGGAAASKRSKSDNAEPAKRQRHTLNFLGDQLLDSSDGKGYKSWWLGALTFYDFVYQRHGMWHSYSISNDVPRVDACLIKFVLRTSESMCFDGNNLTRDAWLHMLAEDFVTDEFVWLSLDARKSLIQVFGKNRARPSEFVALAQLLQQRQLQGFKALQVDFPFFMNQKLDLKNIGHALHSFQVYRNMKLMENKQIHKQEPGTSQPVLYNSRTYMMDSENCEVCSHPENEDELVLCDMCQRMFHKYCINMKELPPASWVCTACKKLQNYPHEGLVVEQEVISID
ncbi:hypothetical protein JG688_00010549 [Phytophthora aleatoria]|uniref:PHD-type domain-containing protein n=1 Tax=Phytophthora aleatoria TaxID=2496075 RepID=A0A8J5M396_9STRA|nr:hypothetical protein JG688_00010549 [Phytophthora aleatoria]